MLISATKTVFLVNLSGAIVIALMSTMFPWDTEKQQVADFARQGCWIIVGLNFLLAGLAEKSWRYRTMFLNFFFATGILRALDLATGFGFFRLISSDKFIDHYLYQYLSCGLIPIAQFFAVLYAGVTVAMNRLSTITIYSICLLGVIPIAFVIYYPYVNNPKYLYTVKDVTDFRIIDRGIDEVRSREKREPEDIHVAELVGLSKWGEGDRRIGELSTYETMQRIREIRPYVTGQNYLLLLFKPLHKNVSMINLFCVAVLVVGFLFQLVFDPPQTPYIDRILAVFLICFAFEALHYFIYSKTVEVDKYWGNFALSALLSLSSTLLFLPVLWTRQRFAASAAAKYYERKIESSPSEVSRWRDEIDGFILRHFFKKNKISRRLIHKKP